MNSPLKIIPNLITTSSSKKKMALVLCVAFILISCKKPSIENPISYLLQNSEETAIKNVMDRLTDHEVQIQYTQIDRIKGEIKFTDYSFQVDSNQYFYPASTVKFPIAVLALEYLSDHRDLHLNTKFYVEGDTLETTFRDEIIKIFAVSDNDANNRLFELFGQVEINDKLASKGIQPVRISHRLSTENADDVTTRPLIYYLNDSTSSILLLTISSPPATLDLRGITKGKAYISEDRLTEEAFDFSLKNYFPITTQQEVMKRVIFPEFYKDGQIFSLGQTERDLLLKAMSSPPRIWGYEEEEYYDSYVKFFIYGDSRNPIPDHIKIYNKVGYAYGTVTDCAYIRDEKNDVEFILTATILVNNNEVFNDDNYEYETIGIPFLAALGREIYAYELKRK